MKKIHFIALLLIAAAVAVLISFTGEVEAYGNFKDAASTRKSMKVVGTLLKNKPMVYNPEEDPNKFEFYLKDQNGDERKVVLLKPKPQDFEMSEQIVLTGEDKNGTFVASDVLLKCPSKYKNEEIYIRENKPEAPVKNS